MNPALIITAIIVFLLSLASLIIACRQFMQKGFLFNNAYIWASKEEREAMNKQPHYRQSAIVFSGISALFLLLGIEIVTGTARFFALIICLSLGLIVYAIASSVAIEAKNK